MATAHAKHRFRLGQMVSFNPEGRAAFPLLSKRHPFAKIVRAPHLRGVDYNGKPNFLITVQFGDTLRREVWSASFFRAIHRMGVKRPRVHRRRKS